MLEEMLVRNGIENLLITGVVTNPCVLNATLDAVMHGYNVTVPPDAVTGLNNEHHDAALEMIEVVRGTVV